MSSKSKPGDAQSSDAQSREDSNGDPFAVVSAYGSHARIPSVVGASSTSSGPFLTSTGQTNHVVTSTDSSAEGQGQDIAVPSSSILGRIPSLSGNLVQQSQPVPSKSLSNPFLSPAVSSSHVNQYGQWTTSTFNQGARHRQQQQHSMEDHELTMNSIQLMALRELAAATLLRGDEDARDLNEGDDEHARDVSETPDHAMDDAFHDQGGEDEPLYDDDDHDRLPPPAREASIKQTNGQESDRVEIIVTDGPDHHHHLTDAGLETGNDDESKSIVGDVFLDEMVQSGAYKFKARHFAGDTDSDSHVTHQAHRRRAAKSSKDKLKVGNGGGLGAPSIKGNNMSDLMEASKRSVKKGGVAEICAICDRPLPKPIEAMTLSIKSLKPRFFRELKRTYPLRTFHPSDRICIKDVHNVMQLRIEQLLEEDQTQLSRLQDDAMRNLGDFELQEQNWQKQFERGWTFGEKAADIVAKFGGSWNFILALLFFLLCWAGLNA
jgi:hypothetical protein